MSWKNELTRVGEKIDTVVRMLQVIQGQTAINGKRIEAVRVLLDQQIKNQSRAADRMADRLIEMAMVNKDKAREAASHRRTLNEEEVEGKDLWQDSPNTQWPPPGCDAVNIP